MAGHAATLGLEWRHPDSITCYFPFFLLFVNSKCVQSGIPAVHSLPPPSYTGIFSFLFFPPPAPTRVKSPRTPFSYSGEIVIHPYQVTTRSSVPGCTARATSPGCPSPPRRRLWCPRDGRAKSVSSHPPAVLLTSHLPSQSSHLQLSTTPAMFHCVLSKIINNQTRQRMIVESICFLLFFWINTT